MFASARLMLPWQSTPIRDVIISSNDSHGKAEPANLPPTTFTLAESVIDWMHGACNCNTRLIISAMRANTGYSCVPADVHHSNLLLCVRAAAQYGIREGPVRYTTWLRHPPALVVGLHKEPGRIKQGRSRHRVTLKCSVLSACQAGRMAMGTASPELSSMMARSRLSPCSTACVPQPTA